MLWGHGEQMCLWSVSWCCQINVLSLARVHAPALGWAKCPPLFRKITATLEATELFAHCRADLAIWGYNQVKERVQMYSSKLSNLNFSKFKLLIQMTWYPLIFILGFNSSLIISTFLQCFLLGSWRWISSPVLLLAYPESILTLPVCYWNTPKGLKCLLG